MRRSKEEGFNSPNKIFNFCTTTALQESELKKYKSIETLNISKTDIKNLVIAKERNLILLTNDSKLYTEASRRGVKVYDLRQILKVIYQERRIPEKEIRELMQEIEKKDNTFIKDKEDIFRKV